MSSFHRSSIPVKNLHKPFSSFIISGFWLTLRGNKISETSETGIIISRQRYKKENVNFHFKSRLCSSVQFTADVESFFYPTNENWKFEKLQVKIYWFCVLKRKGYRIINVQINISFLLCERFWTYVKQWKTFLYRLNAIWKFAYLVLLQTFLPWSKTRFSIIWKDGEIIQIELRNE